MISNRDEQKKANMRGPTVRTRKQSLGVISSRSNRSSFDRLARGPTLRPSNVNVSGILEEHLQPPPNPSSLIPNLNQTGRISITWNQTADGTATGCGCCFV
jgi:hypothetical protein